MTFASFQDFGKRDSPRQWLNKCVKCTNGRLRMCLRHSFGMRPIPQDFFNFKELISFCKSHGPILSGGLLSAASSRAWTLVSTRRSWFSSYKSWCVNWFSKQSAIALAFSDGWNLRPEGPWIAVGVLGPSLFQRDLAMGQIAWGVTSVLPVFVSHRSSVFFGVTRLIEFVTQLTAVLHAGSLVSCRNCFSVRLCFNSQSRQGVSLFMSDSVTLLIASLCAKVTEAVKSRATLSASTHELISILGDINSEARLWNWSQSLNLK
jgi:hypothetical protein